MAYSLRVLVCGIMCCTVRSASPLERRCGALIYAGGVLRRVPFGPLDTRCKLRLILGKPGQRPLPT